MYSAIIESTLQGKSSKMESFYFWVELFDFRQKRTCFKQSDEPAGLLIYISEKV